MTAPHGRDTIPKMKFNEKITLPSRISKPASPSKSRNEESQSFSSTLLPTSPVFHKTQNHRNRNKNMGDIFENAPLSPIEDYMSSGNITMQMEDIPSDSENNTQRENNDTSDPSGRVLCVCV